MATTNNAATVNIDELFKPRLPEEVVEVEGRRFRVRGMSRTEVVALRGKGLTMAEVEQQMIVTAVLEPKLTAGQAKRWQDAAPAGELEDLMNAIGRLSKMDKSAAKEVMKNFREES